MVFEMALLSTSLCYTSRQISLYSSALKKAQLGVAISHHYFIVYADVL
jgi:hypothetical protein